MTCFFKINYAAHSKDNYKLYKYFRKLLGFLMINWFSNRKADAISRYQTNRKFQIRISDFKSLGYLRFLETLEHWQRRTKDALCGAKKKGSNAKHVSQWHRLRISKEFSKNTISPCEKNSWYRRSDTLTAPSHGFVWSDRSDVVMNKESSISRWLGSSLWIPAVKKKDIHLVTTLVLHLWWHRIVLPDDDLQNITL